jgi:hypothetical protein
MRNGVQFGTERRLIERLQNRLPPRWRTVLRRLPPGSRDTGYDALLEIASPDGSKGVFAGEGRRRIDPRDVPSVVGAAKRASDGRPVLLLTEFLSKRTRDVLRQEGASYADATGNIRVALDRPGLFLEAQGSDRDPGSEPRPLRSLRGAAAGRIVRALCDIDPPYGVRELALKASTPLGSVGRVIGLLDREALVERDGRGRVEKARRPELVRRWVQDYGLQKSNDATSYLAPRGIPAFLDGLRSARGYSITGSLAASRRSTVAPSRLATVYTEEPDTLAQELRLSEAQIGANVLLLCPYDPVVFERTWSEDGMVFAALSQVAADLLTSPGRGPSEGEDLLRWMQENVRGWEG